MFPPEAETIPPDENMDDVIVGEIVDEEPEPKKSRLRTGYTEPTTKVGDDKARATPPKLDEWMDFFSRVCIRAATDFYIDAAFRDIDEEWLTPREIDRIKLDETERNRIARPLAELANKTKFTRKHGRSIIATAGSIDSVIQLGMWFSRVNRIAAKYRELGLANPAQPRRRQQQTRASNGQTPPPAAARFTPPPPPQETDNERPRQSAPDGEQNGRSKWRPNIAGEVAYPDAG